MNTDEQFHRASDEQNAVHGNSELNENCDDESAAKKKETSDESVDFGNTLKGLELKDTWHIMSETRQREIGGLRRHFGACNFANQAGASIQLVKRLKLSSKLDGHTGCVNALHFNESGKFSV
jgi:hypothetical protein